MLDTLASFAFVGAAVIATAMIRMKDSNNLACGLPGIAICVVIGILATIGNDIAKKGGD